MNNKKELLEKLKGMEAVVPVSRIVREASELIELESIVKRIFSREDSLSDASVFQLGQLLGTLARVETLLVGDLPREGHKALEKLHNAILQDMTGEKNTEENNG